MTIVEKKWWKCPDCKDEKTPGKKYLKGTGFYACRTCKGKGKVFWSRGDSKGYGYGI
jgi:hypothetical protein